MKQMKRLILSILILPAGMVFAASSLKIQYTDSLPEGCRQLGEIQVGDSAWGRSQTEVVETLKGEAAALGANFLLIDLKRVNNPKRGVYYYGWGTAGICK